MRTLSHKMKKQSGISLMEVIIVIIVLGILAALALPNFSIAVEKVKAEEGISALSAIYRSQVRHKAEHGYYAVYFNTCSSGGLGPPQCLDVDLPILNHFDKSSFSLSCGQNLSGTDCPGSGNAEVSCGGAFYGALAGIRRPDPTAPLTSTLYVLYVLTDGRIMCQASDWGSGDCTGICQKLGFGDISEFP